MQKTFFLFFFLLFCGAASAAEEGNSVRELQILRENYIRLVLAPENASGPLTGLLASVPRDQEGADQMVVELQECYPLDSAGIREMLETLGPDGCWPDIDYADTKRSSWEPRKHVRRLLELAKAYHSTRAGFFHSPDIGEAIHRGLGYWFDAGLVCRNWWYNQIGIPKTLGSVFILFEEQLTEEEKAAAVREMEKSAFGMTGQNKVWLAGNVLVRAMLQNDYDLVCQARDTIVSEIVTGQAEGIQPDWSFHQHGPQQQFGNYGLAFIRSMGFYSGLFAETSLAIEEEQLNLLSNLLGEGYRWILWKGYMDVNSLDRQLFRNAPVDKAFSVAFAAQELARSGNRKCLGTEAAILSDNFDPRPPRNGLTGYKHFDHSDMTVHRTGNWMASLKMASDRIIGTELVNEDNLKGFYMADGALYTYIDGNEYLDVFPYWDWRKIPGITAYETDEPVPTYSYTGPRARNHSAFVGGISDGNIGMSVMELNRDGLRARKAWVFTDDFICAFGGGIATDTTLVVTTTIDQRLKRDHLWIYGRNREWVPVTDGESFTDTEARFFHDKTGYIVLPGDPCIARHGMSSGRWHDFMGVYRPEEVSGEIIALYFGHGMSPRNASYCYFILPDTERQSVETFDTSAVRILRNDSCIQAATVPAAGIWFVAAREPAAVELDHGFTAEIREPGLYLYRYTAGKWNYSFCAL